MPSQFDSPSQLRLLTPGLVLIILADGVNVWVTVGVMLVVIVGVGVGALPWLAVGLLALKISL